MQQGQVGGQRSSVWSHARYNVGSTWQIVSVAFWVAWRCRLVLAVFLYYYSLPSPFYFSTDLFSVTCTPPYFPLTYSMWPPSLFSTDLFNVTIPPYFHWLIQCDHPSLFPLTYSVWPPLLIFHWLIQCDHPSLFSTDLFSVTGVRAVCGGSWLGCRDCQPGEWYFSSGALAPNLHKAMQLLIEKFPTTWKWWWNVHSWTWTLWAPTADQIQTSPFNS